MAEPNDEVVQKLRLIASTWPNHAESALLTGKQLHDALESLIQNPPLWMRPPPSQQSSAQMIDSGPSSETISSRQSGIGAQHMGQRNISSAGFVALSPTDSRTVRWYSSEMDSFATYLTSKANVLNQNELVAQDVCRFISLLGSKLQIEFSQPCTEQVVRYLADLLNSPSEWIIQDSLRALSYVLANNLTTVPKQAQSLYRQLRQLAQTALTGHSDTHRLAINCLGSIIPKSESLLEPFFIDIFEFSLKLLQNVLENQTKYTNEMLKVSKLLNSVFRMLQNVLSEGKTIHANKIDNLIPLIRGFFAFGKSSVQTKAGNVKSPNQGRAAPLSDSDVSDSEESGNSTWNQSSRVRANALTCLAIIAKLTPKLIHKHWNLLISLDYSSFYSPGLLQILASDASSKVKLAAATALTNMMDDSRKYLIVAQYKVPKGKSTFTSLSVTLGSLVNYMITEALLVIDKEFNNSVLIQTMRFLAALLSNINLENMKENVLGSICRKLFQFTKPSDDLMLRVTSLTCFGSTLNSKSKIPEIELFVKSHPVMVSAMQASLLTAICSWSSPSEALPIRLESLQVLSKLAAVYYEAICLEWQRVFQTCEQGLTASEQNIRVFCAKTMENYTSNMNKRLCDGHEPHGSVSIWNQNLVKITVKCLSDALPQTIVSSLNIISSIPIDFLDDEQYSCLGLQLSCLAKPLQSSVPFVVVAALRTCSVLFHPLTLKHDADGLRLISSLIVKLQKSTDVTVETKASWALACIFETFLKRGMSPPFLVSLLTPDADFSHSKDAKYVQHYARLFGFKLLCLRDPVERKLIMKGFDDLINSPSDKIRGTICYTFGSLLQYASDDDSFMKKETKNINTKLLKRMNEDESAKVKTLAAQALHRGKRLTFSETYSLLYSHLILLTDQPRTSRMGDLVTLNPHESQITINIHRYICQILDTENSDMSYFSADMNVMLLKLLEFSWNVCSASSPSRPTTSDTAEESVVPLNIPQNLPEVTRILLLKLRESNIVTIQSLFVKWLRESQISPEYLPKDGFASFLQDISAPRK